VNAPAAIVLAAGEGRRMGGPKALLVLDGKPLVCGHVERLGEVGCRPVVVVVRPSIFGDVRRLLGAVPAVHLVASETSSMAASLAVGLEHVPPATQSVVVSMIDARPVQCATLQGLIATVMEEGVLVATPSYAGRGGHPVVARETLLRRFRHGYRGTLRDLIRSVEPQRRRLDVDDAAVGDDLDTPADVAAVAVRGT
jgi:CTP:molybdopterin cytidylyltransferase MocA